MELQHSASAPIAPLLVLPAAYLLIHRRGLSKPST